MAEIKLIEGGVDMLVSPTFQAIKTLVEIGIFAFAAWVTLKVYQQTQKSNKSRTYATQVTFSHNRFESYGDDDKKLKKPRLKFRTRGESKLSQILPEDSRLLKEAEKAALACTPKNALIRIPNDYMQDTFLSYLSSEWVKIEGSRAALLRGLSDYLPRSARIALKKSIHTNNYVIAATYEHFDEKFISKIRVISILEEDLKTRDFSDETQFAYENPLHATRISIALRQMQEIYNDPNRRDHYMVIWEHSLLASA